MIKVEVHVPPEKSERITGYPCLGQSRNDGPIVLFTEKSVGTVVVEESSAYPMGFHSTTWNMPQFIPFTGTLTLSNEEV